VIPAHQTTKKNLLHAEDMRQVTNALHWFEQKTSSIWCTTFRIHFGAYL